MLVVPRVLIMGGMGSVWRGGRVMSVHVFGYYPRRREDQ